MYPNIYKNLESTGKPQDYEAISQNIVYTPYTMPWSDLSTNGRHAYYLHKIYKTPSYLKRGLLCEGGVFLKNRITKDNQTRYQEKFNNFNYDDYDIVMDVTETWSIGISADGNIEVTLSTDGTKYTKERSGGVSGGTIKETTVTYTGTTVTTRIVQGTSDTTTTTTNNSLTSSHSLTGGQNTTTINSNTDKSGTGLTESDDINYYTKRQWDESQTLSNQYLLTDLINLVDSSVTLDSQNASIGKTYPRAWEEPRRAEISYYKSGGLVRTFYWGSSQDSVELSYLSRDAQQTKDLAEWNNGIKIEYQTSKYESGIVDAKLTQGNNSQTLTELIPLEKKYRDKYGIFHKDNLEINDVKSEVKFELKISGGYAKKDETYEKKAHTYYRERVVCLDGKERKFEVYIEGRDIDYNLITESFVEETTEYKTPWLHEDSSSNIYDIVQKVEIKVYIKNANDQWVEEREDATTMEQSNDISKAKYYVESKIRTGELWGHTALDGSETENRWMNMTRTVNGSDSGSVIEAGKECRDDANVTLSYEATANYHENSGWIENKILTSNLTINNQNCTIDVTGIEGTHKEVTINRFRTGIPLASPTQITPTSLIGTESGTSEQAIYYRKSLNGNENLISQSNGTTTIQHPNEHTQTQPNRLLNNIPIPLTVNSGQSETITRIKAKGRA